MSGDDSVEALQATLQNAFAVLGRKPNVVPTISDEPKYKHHLAILESQLDETKRELYETRRALSVSTSDLEKMTTQYIACKNELDCAAQQLKSANELLSGATLEAEELRKRISNSTLENDKIRQELEDVSQQNALSQKALSDREKEKSDLISQLNESCESSRTLEIMLTDLKRQTVLDMDKEIRQQVAVSYISSCVIQRCQRKHIFLKWKAWIVHRRLSQLNSETATLELENRDLKLSLSETEKSLESVVSEVEEYRRRRKYAVSVGCSACPSTTTKSTMTTDIRSRQADLLSYSRGSSTELDEIAKLRWEIDRQAREFARQMEDRMAVIAFMEMETSRLSGELEVQKQNNLSCETSRSELVNELRVLQSVLGRQNESIITLNSDYTKAELRAQNHCKRQLATAATDMKAIMLKATDALSRSSADRALRSAFIAWQLFSRLRLNSRVDASTQHTNRSIEQMNHITATTLSSQHDRSRMKELWARWGYFVSNAKEDRARAAKKLDVSSVECQTEVASAVKSTHEQCAGVVFSPQSEGLITRRLEKLRMAHVYELASAARFAGIERAASDERHERTIKLAKSWFCWKLKYRLRTSWNNPDFTSNQEDIEQYRMKISHVGRDVENTALLLEQANSKIASFQATMDELRHALLQSNSINQILSTHNRTLRVEIDRLKEVTT